MLKFKFLTRHIWQILEVTFCPFEKTNKTEFECCIMEISLLGIQEFYGISPSFMYTLIRCEKRKDKWVGAKGGNQSSKLCYNPDMRRVGLRLGVLVVGNNKWEEEKAVERKSQWDHPKPLLHVRDGRERKTQGRLKFSGAVRMKVHWEKYGNLAWDLRESSAFSKGEPTFRCTDWSQGRTTVLPGREGNATAAQERSQAQRSRSVSHLHKHDCPIKTTWAVWGQEWRGGRAKGSSWCSWGSATFKGSR